MNGGRGWMHARDGKKNKDSGFKKNLASNGSERFDPIATFSCQNGPQKHPDNEGDQSNQSLGSGNALSLAHSQSQQNRVTRHVRGKNVRAQVSDGVDASSGPGKEQHSNPAPRGDK